jgi:hypothetical protein
MSYTCPRCGMVSHNPNDEKHRYCGACHEFEHDEFVCTSCGRMIISIPPVDPPPTRCAVCQHLEEFVADPVEREAMRRRLEL